MTDADTLADTRADATPRAIRWWARRDAAFVARMATLIVFVCHGLLFASWTAHIPLIRSGLDLSDSALGLALFGAPVGSITATLAASWLIPRVGSRRMVQLCLIGYCATGWTVGLASTQLQLFLALALWGSFMGSLDVSMNAQAVFVERRLGTPIMSSFHGMWSVGAFVGVAIGALCVSAGVSLTVQLIVLGLAVLLIAGSATRRMLPDPIHEDASGSPVAPGQGPTVWRNPVVLVVGAIVLAAMLCEGAAADWSAVYLHDSLGTTAGIAALGYAAFSISMVIGRLSGDRLLARFAPRTLLPILATIATIGMTAALSIGGPAVAFVGFITLGVGVALVIPAAFSAAGALPGVHPGAAVGAVSAIGFAGFVMGPPLIGHLADIVTLPVALSMLPVLTAIIAISIRRTRGFAPVPKPAVSAGS